MFIATFVCQNCKTSNKQELLFKKKKTIITCTFCNASVMTVNQVTGCFVVISNKIGLVQIIHSPYDYKTATKKFNTQFKGKPKFKIEAIFSSKNFIAEQAKIDRNRKLKKYRSLTKKKFYKIEISEAISIIEHILKRKPEWIYNRDYMAPFLPGFKS